MLCCVYILYSARFNRYYIGIAEDSNKRLSEHNNGKVRSTRPFVPWKIVHIEYYRTKQEARRREKYLKSAAGRRWRSKNIKIEMGD
jgi:putative endonuclease